MMNWQVATGEIISSSSKISNCISGYRRNFIRTQGPLSGTHELFGVISSGPGEIELELQLQLTLLRAAQFSCPPNSLPPPPDDN